MFRFIKATEEYNTFENLTVTAKVTFFSEDAIDNLTLKNVTVKAKAE